METTPTSTTEAAPPQRSHRPRIDPDEIGPAELLMPRPEAQPYSWDEMGDQQQRAATLIHEWVTTFATKTPLTRLPPTGPFTWQAADLQRPSNVLLIHGGRGSGKTSLMLTLLEFWRRPLAQRLRADELSLENDGWAAGGARGAARQGAAAKPLLPFQGGTGFIIPLKPLDLQPLPRSTSLVAWISSRIWEFATLLERQASGPSNARRPRPIASWYPDAQDEPRWRKAWQELATAIAYGWDSNLEQRRGSLDPEAYAEELAESERSRHGVVLKWREFVTEVVGHAVELFHPTLQDQARLVLPLDDVDMNPHRCVELLDLVRFLWHPQLIFLLTGQSRLFAKMLRIQQHGLMRMELGTGGTTHREHQSMEARPSAHELASQSFDRTIPTSQRFRLGKVPQPDRVHCLWTWINACIKNLVDAADEQKHHDAKLALERMEARFIREPFLQYALPPYFRRLRNVQQLLLRAYMENETESCMVFRIWREAVEDKTLSRRADREFASSVRFSSIVEDGVEQGPATDSRSSWSERLRVSPAAPITLRSTREWTLLHPDAGRDIRIEVGGLSEFVWRSAEDPSRRAPKYATALLLLALDVALENDGVLEREFRMDGLLAPFVTVHVPVHLKGRTLVVPFCWPTPDWVGSIGVSHFNRLWTRGFRQLLSYERPRSDRPESWVAPRLRAESGATLLKLLKAFQESVRAVPQKYALPKEAMPSALANKYQDDWEIDRRVLLAAPESGLTGAELDDQLAYCFEPESHIRKRFSKSAARRVRLARARLALARVPPDLRKDLTPERLLTAIDAQHGQGSRWLSEMK